MKMVLLILLGLTGLALGNGGGYFRGGVEGTGDVRGFEPERTEKVQIADELLRVRFHEEFADVEVNYTMRNLTEDRVKVRFGFPVEESRDHPMDPGGGIYDPEEKQVGKDPHYCENYRITAGGEPVKVKWEGEERPRGGDRRFDTIAGWLISELKFDAGESKRVRITFRSHYPEEMWSVSDDGHRKAATFRYRLSTAAVWGGPIAKGRIELIPDGIPAGELRAIKPVNRFRKEGRSWVWEFENLEPTLADDLEIEARPAVESYGRNLGDWDRAQDWVGYVKRGGKWFIEHANYDVKASSTLEPQGGNSYEAAKVKGWEGAWSEGATGSGAGEWLEVTPKVPKPLRSIRIRPGYAKSDELFEANARPKRVEVLLNGEHRFEAELLDENEEQGIVVIDYAKPVKSVRLTFREVYPGSKFEDLCVSEVRLEAVLDEKPEITPAR